MDLGLKGRLAFVTGSSRGLGKVIAQTLAQEGVNLFIHGHTDETVFKTADEISEKFGVKTWPCVIDATDAKEIKYFFELSTFTSIGKLDILINNVGNIETFGRFEDLKDEDWQKSFELTFMSAVRFTREAIPYLEKSGQGRIINISSLPSHQPSHFNPHYSAVKAALNNLTKHLANVLGPKNILVNAICPSTLKGGGWERNVQSRAQRENITISEAETLMEKEEIGKSPIGKIGTLEDVANLVVYLASDKANFLTGHIYDVDGGITRGI